jgi:hypothetical protein
MTSPSPFDHRPDPELGALLREALVPEEDPAFVERVLGALARTGDGYPSLWWQVLGTWARHGVAAALVGLAAATLWWASASRGNEADASLEEVFLATADQVAPPFLTATTAPPSFDQVLASSLEP